MDWGRMTRIKSPGQVKVRGCLMIEAPVGYVEYVSEKKQADVSQGKIFDTTFQFVERPTKITNTRAVCTKRMAETAFTWCYLKNIAERLHCQSEGFRFQPLHTAFQIPCRLAGENRGLQFRNPLR